MIIHISASDIRNKFELVYLIYLIMKIFEHRSSCDTQDILCRIHWQDIQLQKKKLWFKCAIVIIQISNSVTCSPVLKRVRELGFHWFRGNGLSPVRRRAITWSNAALSSIGLLGTSFSEIWIWIVSFPMHLKMSSAKMAAILSRS